MEHGCLSFTSARDVSGPKFEAGIWNDFAPIQSYIYIVLKVWTLAFDKLFSG